MSELILIIEDQEDNRRIMRDLFTSAGYKVIEAVNGEAGVMSSRDPLSRLDPDGHSTTRFRRIRGYEADQSQPRPELNPGHCGHLLCAERR